MAAAVLHVNDRGHRRRAPEPPGLHIWGAVQLKLYRFRQTLRIPHELELPDVEVILHEEDDRLLAEILPGLRPLSEGSSETADPRHRPEDVLAGRHLTRKRAP